MSSSWHGALGHWNHYGQTFSDPVILRLKRTLDKSATACSIPSLGLGRADDMGRRWMGHHGSVGWNGAEQLVWHASRFASKSLVKSAPSGGLQVARDVAGRLKTLRHWDIEIEDDWGISYDFYDFGLSSYIFGQKSKNLGRNLGTWMLRHEKCSDQLGSRGLSTRSVTDPPVPRSWDHLPIGQYEKSYPWSHNSLVVLNVICLTIPLWGVNKFEPYPNKEWLGKSTTWAWQGFTASLEVWLSAGGSRCKTQPCRSLFVLLEKCQAHKMAIWSATSGFVWFCWELPRIDAWPSFSSLKVRNLPTFGGLLKHSSDRVFSYNLDRLNLGAEGLKGQPLGANWTNC